MDYVSLKQLAKELRIDRSALRKFVLKEGFVPHRMRTPDSGGQSTLVFTAEEAEQIRAVRNGFGGFAPVIDDGIGYFYAVQIVPDLAPDRIKFGYASDVGRRLGEHRTVSPTATVLRSWPSRRCWEDTARDAITAVGCTPLSGEVFCVDDIDVVLQRADAFFALMPPVC